jgi:hypothetical protein
MSKVKMYVAPPKTTANEAKAAGNKLEYFKLKLAATQPKSQRHKYFERHLARFQKEAAAL